ncbi:hypothetical protein MKZ38_000438 [Zalerion maritima]|uniref:Ribosomal eL28/Mak16 domain-containing protein n=1 Tax=Zalerion maritima TaxID=339359 RepID=A0AAD5S008_9PEZI|nr:hypothetical protein MKZ38_000438 [Zalerion maritima]
MPHTHHSNVSPDLVWEIVRNDNAFLVKRKSNGGVQFSRDPLNLQNVNSRKYAGFVNERAVGVNENEKGGVTVTSKKTKHIQRPADSAHTVTYSGNKTGRKTYKAVANMTAKAGYRADLREAAVSRVSAIRRSQRPVKPTPERKPRGKKAKVVDEEA